MLLSDKAHWLFFHRALALRRQEFQLNLELFGYAWASKLLCAPDHHVQSWNSWYRLFWDGWEERQVKLSDPKLFNSFYESTDVLESWDVQWISECELEVKRLQIKQYCRNAIFSFISSSYGINFQAGFFPFFSLWSPASVLIGFVNFFFWCEKLKGYFLLILTPLQKFWNFSNMMSAELGDLVRFWLRWLPKNLW